MYIGIDPGLSGAVGILAADGALVALHDTPVLILSTSRGSRVEYALPGMAALLRPYTASGVQVFIEESQAMPGQGISSTWTTGYGFGVWLGILGALGLAYTTESALTSGSAAWGSPAIKSRHDCGQCSCSLAPICAARKITAELRRYCWRGGASTQHA